MTYLAVRAMSVACGSGARGSLACLASRLTEAGGASSFAMTVPRPHLVDLNSAIDPPHKRVCSQKTDRACEEAVDQAGEEAVREEQDGADEAADVEHMHVVVDAVGEDPDAAAAAEEERLPPPVIILFRNVSMGLLAGVDECKEETYFRAQLHVNSDDRRLHYREY